MRTRKKKLRIKEEFKKSGYFWLPSNPENKIPGTLTIKDGGNIKLEVIGLFDESAEAINKAMGGEDSSIERIIGHIEKYGLITLDNCFYKKYSVPLGGIYKSDIHVDMALLGVAYDDKELILLNNFEFSIEGIDEWVGINGIEAKIQQITNTNKIIGASLTYVPPKEISITLNNGMKLLIIFAWTFPTLSNKKEAKITQKTSFKLTSDNECPLKDFTLVAYKITNFLGFAIDKTVCIEKITVSSNSIYRELHNEKSSLVPISLYYASLPYVKNESTFKQKEMLFNFEQIQKDAELIINKWFDAYNKLDVVLDLYFSTKIGAHKYLDGKFLTLVQGLESYHRRTSNTNTMSELDFEKLIKNLLKHCPEEHKKWLSGRLKYGNEINLRQRIKSIIEPFKEFIGTSKERKELINDIVDTRNYLTHYDKSLELKIMKNSTLWSLCLKMEAIFQLHLLKVLGFDEHRIKSVLDDSYSLQQKLK